MTDFYIRKAEPIDIPTICDIVQQMTPDSWHDYRKAEKKFRSHIQNNPDYFLFVADNGLRIIGTCMIHLQHKLSYHCGTAAHLEDVVVDENWRGEGVGQALVKRAIETAKSFNCYKIMLTCYPKTTPFYEKLGFEQHALEMRMNLIDDLYPKDEK